MLVGQFACTSVQLSPMVLLAPLHQVLIQREVFERPVDGRENGVAKLVDRAGVIDDSACRSTSTAVSSFASASSSDFSITLSGARATLARPRSMDWTWVARPDR